MVEPLSFLSSPRDSAAVRLALRLRARGIGVSGRVTERELYDALAFFLREELARTPAPVGGDCALVGEGFALRLPLLRMAGRLGLGEALDGVLRPYGYTLHSLSANQEGPPPAPEGNVLGELADSVLSAGLSAQVFSLYRNPVTDRLSPWLTPHPEEGAAVSFGGQVEEHFRGGAPMEVRVQGAREVTAVPLRGQMAGPAGCGTAQLFLFRCGRNTPDPCGSSSAGGYWLARRAQETGFCTVGGRAEQRDEESVLTAGYFLAAAAVRTLFRRRFTDSGQEGWPPLLLYGPAALLCIPECMRLWMDECAATWDSAFHRACRLCRCVLTPAQTERTYREDLFTLLLPRLAAILREVDRRAPATAPRIFRQGRVCLTPLSHRCLLLGQDTFPTRAALGAFLEK